MLTLFERYPIAVAVPAKPMIAFMRNAQQVLNAIDVWRIHTINSKAIDGLERPVGSRWKVVPPMSWSRGSIRDLEVSPKKFRDTDSAGSHFVRVGRVLSVNRRRDLSGVDGDTGYYAAGDDDSYRE